MKIGKQDFNGKIAEYVTTRIMPSMGNKLALFLVAAAVQTNRIGTDLVGDNTLKMLGIMDEEGKIETETVRAAMTAGMKKVENDLHIPLVGLHFNQGDVDKFLAFLEAEAPS